MPIISDETKKKYVDALHPVSILEKDELDAFEDFDELYRAYSETAKLYNQVIEHYKETCKENIDLRREVREYGQKRN